MPLSNAIHGREFDKFVADSQGDTAVRTVVTDGSFNVDAVPSGLRNAGRHTEVTVIDTGWTALPATPLSDRNAISIQNNTNFDIKINYDNSVIGYFGMTIRSGEERSYDIKDTIVIYGRVENGAGSAVIDIEELS